MAELRSWRLELPQTTPMSLNHREHYAVKARRVRALRQTAALLALQARVPALERVALELHYAPRDKRRRDPLNLVATLKPLEDGIVDAGVIPDDTPEYSRPTMPVIDPPSSTGRGRLYLIVQELPAHEPATERTAP